MRENSASSSPSLLIRRGNNFTPSPLVGEGWGGGRITERRGHSVSPPTLPSPTRGEGSRVPSVHPDCKGYFCAGPKRLVLPDGSSFATPLACSCAVRENEHVR